MPSRPINPRKVAKTTNKLRRQDAKEAALDSAAKKVRAGEYKQSRVAKNLGFTDPSYRTVPQLGAVSKEARAARKDARKTLKTSAIRQTVLINKAAKERTPAVKVQPRLDESRTAANKAGAKAGLSDKKMNKITGKTANAVAKKMYRGNK